MAKKITDEELALLPEKERESILKNREYFKNYREKNREKLTDNNRKYMQSEKGKNNKKKYREATKQEKAITDKIYRENNKEKLSEYFKDYREKNKEIILNRVKKYRENNKEYFKNYAKEYYSINIEKKKKYDKEFRAKYRKTEKGKLIIKKHDLIRRHNEKNIEHLLGIGDLKFIYKKFNNQCFNCGSENKLHLDHHYPLSKGYPLIIKNAVVLCRTCNSSKRNKLPQNYYTEAKLKQLETFFDIATKEEMDQYRKAI